MHMTYLKRCSSCHKYQNHEGWIEPDTIQIKMIAEQVNRHRAKVIEILCPDCKFIIKEALKYHTI